MRHIGEWLSKENEISLLRLTLVALLGLSVLGILHSTNRGSTGQTSTCSRGRTKPTSGSFRQSRRQSSAFGPNRS